MYVGKQIVHGENHYIICSAQGVYPDAQPRPVMVALNIAEGKYSIVSIEGIDSMNALGYAFTW